MIEMRVRYEDRFGFGHIRRGEAELMSTGRPVEIGVE
jgi:hypothetical protein